MDSLANLGGKLSSFNPFGQKNDDSTPKSEENPSGNAQSSGSEAPPSEENTAATDHPSEQSSTADTSTVFAQAFNPISKFGSKLTDFMASSSTTEGNEKDPAGHSSEASEGSALNAEVAADKIKTFGTSLFSYGKQASASMLKSTTDALEQIKKTVEEKSPVIADFSKEQEKFIEEKRQNQVFPSQPPWEGVGGGPDAEDKLRVKILELSADERNVLRPVPAGQTFEFDMKAHSNIANLMLSLDSRLESLRFKFVPKRITEENFWRNYFYRVSLLKQSTDLMSSANSAVANAAQSATKEANSNNPATPHNSDSPSPDEKNNPDFQEELERAVQQELNEYELVDDTADDGIDDSDRNLEAEILAEIDSK